MVTKQLEALLSERRVARLDAVLSRRTRNLALVLEDIHDPHNASACLRSAEGLGLQDVYAIEADVSLAPSRRVVQGADKWLDLHRFETTPSCLEALRAEGYRVYASDLQADTSLDAIDFRERVALAFGNEHAGASQALFDGADATFCIPMRGFSQSFNVSVAVAVCLYHAVQQRAARLGPDGDLEAAERETLRAQWIRRSVPKGGAIEAALARRASR